MTHSIGSPLFPTRKESVMIYLDNAATTLKKPPAVLEAVQEAMGSFGNAGRGGR